MANLQDLVLRLRDVEAREVAVGSLLEVLQADPGASDRVAELNAVPGLVDTLHDFLEAWDTHKECLAGKEKTNGDVDDVAREMASREVRDRCADVAKQSLRALVLVTKTIATRLRVVESGGIGPVCRLMDTESFPESIAERAVVLLINCCTNGGGGGGEWNGGGGPETNSRPEKNQPNDDPFSPSAKVKRAVAQTGGVQKIITSLKRTPYDRAGCRAVHLLSLLADEPKVREKFREGGDDIYVGFKALIAFLADDGASFSMSKQSSSSFENDRETPAVPIHVKHAAVAVNLLCTDDVQNKEAFCVAGGIPPLKGLLHFGEKSWPRDGTLKIIPVLTKTVIDAISTLAMDNDLCDQPICDTGVLPSLVGLLTDVRCDFSLKLSVIHAVMHMARDSRDAKRQLTEHGAVPKMRDVVGAYYPSDAQQSAQSGKQSPQNERAHSMYAPWNHSEVMAIPAVSCLVNLATDTEYWGQAELAEENVVGPVKAAFDKAKPGGKFAQVCVAFVHAFVKNNPENAYTVAEVGVLPTLVFHHLRSRDGKRRGDKIAAQEALVTLGAALDADESAREIVGQIAGELLLREALVAGASTGAYLPAEITDKKRLRKEKATLEEVLLLAKNSEDGSVFSLAAEQARLQRKKKRAQEIFDAEAALEKKLVQQLVAREKELLEAEAARVELRKAQARVGQAESAVKKEVNEARAAKKELEGAERALRRKVLKEGENSKAVQMLRETVALKRTSWEKEQREADDAIAAHAASEKVEKERRRLFEREKAEADAAEAAVGKELLEKTKRDEKLNNMDVRARRRFLEQEEAVELAAKKQARTAARNAERITNGDTNLDIEAQAQDDDDTDTEEDDEDPFEKKCCVVS